MSARSMTDAEYKYEELQRILDDLKSNGKPKGTIKIDGWDYFTTLTVTVEQVAQIRDILGTKPGALNESLGAISAGESERASKFCEMRKYIQEDYHSLVGTKDLAAINAARDLLDLPTITQEQLDTIDDWDAFDVMGSQ